MKVPETNYAHAQEVFFEKKETPLPAEELEPYKSRKSDLSLKLAHLLESLAQMKKERENKRLQLSNSEILDLWENHKLDNGKYETRRRPTRRFSPVAKKQILSEDEETGWTVYK